MIRNRSSRWSKLAVEPKPEPVTPPAHSPNSKPGSKPGCETHEAHKKPKSHAKGPSRSWSKCDVIFIMNSMVDFIAQKGCDPFNNLNSFVNFVNNNSPSCNGDALKKITWKLSKSGSDDSNSCVLYLEGGNNVRGNSLSNKGSVYVEKRSILGKYGGEISVRNSTFGENVSILGKSDGGGSCSSVENVGGVNCMENLEKNSGGGGGGEKSKSRSRGRRRGRRTTTVMLVGGELIRDGNEGNGKEKIGGESPVLEVEKGGMKNKNGVNLSDFGFLGKDGVTLLKKSSVGMDHGEEKCTKTQNSVGNMSGGVGVKRSKSGGGVRRRRRRTAIHVGRKAVPKVRDYGGMRQNSKSSSCWKNPNIESKKNGMKNNNLGFWNENEVMMREALRRMISKSVSLGDELQADLSWCPPKIGVLKWNTDASLREDNRTAAIGGVLRDWHGSFRCVFSCPVDCIDSNEVEVRAIYKALELASSKDWLLSLNMVIESDSMNAVTWCNEDNGGPLNLGYMLSFIRECRRWWPGLEITYMGRDSNSVADRLAKQGHQRSEDFVVWM